MKTMLRLLCALVGLWVAPVHAALVNVSLTWVDASADEAGFVVERCEGEGCDSWDAIASTAADTQVYNDIGVTAGNYYSYRVASFTTVRSSWVTLTDVLASLATPTPTATPTNTPTPTPTPTATPSSLEDCTGASFCLLMDEASGDLTDEIGGAVLTDTAGETYSVTGSTGYDPGITIPVNGGFNKTTAVAGTYLGTGDYNLLLVLRVDTVNDTGNTWLFTTTAVSSGSPGYYVVWANTAATKRINVVGWATTGESISTAFQTASITAAYNDGDPHTYEFQFNRTANTLEMFLDDVSQGSVDISNWSGKDVTGSGVGVCRDYRNGIPATTAQTVYFVRVKQSLE